MSAATVRVNQDGKRWVWVAWTSDGPPDASGSCRSRRRAIKKATRAAERLGASTVFYRVPAEASR